MMWLFAETQKEMWLLVSEWLATPALRFPLVRVHTSKIMPHMKFIYFFNANLDVFRAHASNVFPHMTKKNYREH